MRCRYCEYECGKNALRHERVCPLNPEITERLHTRMRAEADEDGHAISTHLYAAIIAQGQGLPCLPIIYRAFGTYAAFCVWCGLLPPLTCWEQPHREQPEDMPGSVMADDYAVYDMSVLRCVPVARAVRVWHPYAHAWVIVGAQEWMQVR